MKMYVAMRPGRTLWLLSGIFFASLISLPGNAQETAVNDPSSSSQQQSNHGQAEIPAFYHLVYTLAENDGAKRLGLQSFVLTVSSDRAAVPSELKVGSKVPVPSGPKDSAIPQVTYVDIGLTIQARTEKVFPGGLEVFSSVEQSSVAVSPDNKILQPVIRNSNLRDVAVLYPNVPVSLGSFDVPGSSRHYEVQVTMQAIRSSR